MNIDPNLDLVLERVVAVPPDRVWRAWTVPEHIVKWFTPEPWSTTKAEVDLRPGGRFFTVMCSPEGEEFPNDACFLEIVPERKLVWTTALVSNFRPAKGPVEPFPFTAMILLEAQGQGTKYTAIALHTTPQHREQHEQMGFHEGWSKALDQLVAAMS